MDHEFLRIRAATERYDVSEVTLRRLAREITRAEGHEFREYLHPGEAELKQLRLENKPFEYELSTRLLGIRYKERKADSEKGGGAAEEAKTETGAGAMGVLESTNDLLREQLKVKDDQIRQLNDSLRAMQQQQNATSMLMVRLSERIPLLAEGTSVRAEVAEERTVTDAVTSETIAEKKESIRARATKMPKANVKKPESRGVFSRLFRRESAKAGVGK